MEAGRFFVAGEREVQNITRDGKVKSFPAPILSTPYYSPDGKYWAMKSYQPPQTGLWVGVDKNFIKVFPDPVSELSWAADNRGLFFVSNKRLYAAFAPDFLPVMLASGFELRGEKGMAWVLP